MAAPYSFTVTMNPRCKLEDFAYQPGRCLSLPPHSVEIVQIRKLIAQEMVNTYGQENLDVTSQTQWYNEIETEAKSIVEPEMQRIRNYVYSPTKENTDLSLSEVNSAIDCICEDTAPNPDENINPRMIKKAGTGFRIALLRLFQLYWSQGKFPDKFEEYHKNPIPKPDKENYNLTTSYRPITFGSLIDKIMEGMTNGI